MSSTNVKEPTCPVYGATLIADSAMSAFRAAKADTNHILSTLILSWCVLESFMNDLPEELEVISRYEDQDPRVKTAATVLCELRNSRASFTSRLTILSAIMNDGELSKGDHRLVPLRLLNDLRDAIIHLKPDQLEMENGVPGQGQMHRKLLKQIETYVKIGLLNDELQTWGLVLYDIRLAEWAVDEMRKGVELIVNQFPVESKVRYWVNGLAKPVFDASLKK